MNNLFSTPFADDDAHQKKLETLWGSSWKKLTPKQRQLVSEILSHLTLVGSGT